MKTESAASLLCGTFPINQLLSEPGEWHRATRSRGRDPRAQAIKTSCELQFPRRHTFCDARIVLLKHVESSKDHLVTETQTVD